MFATPARLASTLLALGCVICALSGCLLPQEDRVLNFPTQRNRPPRIMEELPTLVPADRLITVEAGCSKLEFAFNAEDPDVNDPLTVRWYVDYPRVPFFVPDREQVLAVSGRPQRDEKASLTVDLASGLELPLSQLQLPGVHIVEAVLFDYHLGPDRKPIAISPPDAEILNPSYATSYAWVVNVSRTCPGP